VLEFHAGNVGKLGAPGHVKVGVVLRPTAVVDKLGSSHAKRICPIGTFVSALTGIILDAAVDIEPCVYSSVDGD
jgi:hypothetical protein